MFASLVQKHKDKLTGSKARNKELPSRYGTYFQKPFEVDFRKSSSSSDTFERRRYDSIKEKKIKQTCSIFIQILLFTQFAIFLPLFTGCITLKFVWNQVQEDWQFSAPNLTVTTACFENEERITTTEWSLTGVWSWIDEVMNVLAGMFLLITNVTMLMLIYMRPKNLAPIIVMISGWTTIFLVLDMKGYWVNSWETMVAYIENTMMVERATILKEDLQTWVLYDFLETSKNGTNMNCFMKLIYE